jgi:hypothetical protein
MSATMTSPATSMRSMRCFTVSGCHAQQPLPHGAIPELHHVTTMWLDVITTVVATVIPTPHTLCIGDDHEGASWLPGPTVWCSHACGPLRLSLSLAR